MIASILAAFAPFAETSKTQALHREMHQRRGITIARAASAYHAPERTIVETQSYWAWQALKNGNIPTARKHALRVARTRPFNRESWRLLYCALRGN